MFKVTVMSMWMPLEEHDFDREEDAIAFCIDMRNQQYLVEVWEWIDGEPVREVA